MKIRLAAITDVGKERPNNEDAYIICSDLSQQDWVHSETPTYMPLKKCGAVLVVADGMGGANAGEVASTIATKSIQSTFTKTNIEDVLKNNEIVQFLDTCVKNADSAINKKVSEDPDTCGMGTTIVVCWVVGGTAHIAWCGDSRCYVYNPDNGLKLLTKDHSLVQELVDKGEITEEESFFHPDNNVITKWLGDVDSQANPDIISYPLVANDTLLLCSDGLCGYSTDKEIEEVLKSNHTDILKCRDKLLKHALDAGGYDNICISLASIIGDDQSSPISPTLIHRIKKLLKKRVG